MKTSAVEAVLPGRRRPSLVALFGWTLVLGAIVYFVGRNVPGYFVFTRESYGPYFWPKVSWLFPHIAGGLLALLVGPFQFWPRIRRDYLHVHRIAGRVYVAGVVVGSVAAFGLATTIKQNLSFALGLSGLAFAWITTTGMAFVAIRRKNILQHRQWMVRSYVVTFAFITFRLASDLVRAAHLLPNQERAAILAWACWTIPLLITEVVLQGAAVFKSKA